MRGERRVWPAAVLHTVGWINFLFDRARSRTYTPTTLVMHILHRGGREDHGLSLLARRPSPPMADVVFGDGQEAVRSQAR